jgi:hypothetical protein
MAEPVTAVVTGFADDQDTGDPEPLEGTVAGFGLFDPFSDDREGTAR